MNQRDRLVQRFLLRDQNHLFSELLRARAKDKTLVWMVFEVRLPIGSLTSIMGLSR